MPDRRPTDWKDGVRAFGERVREVRKARGMTQEQLGAASHLSRNEIGMIETGRSYAKDENGRPKDEPRSLKYDTIFNVALALDIDPGELMRLDRTDG